MSDYLILALALNGKVKLTTEEWRQSRPELLTLIKRRLRAG